MKSMLTVVSKLRVGRVEDFARGHGAGAGVGAGRGRADRRRRGDARRIGDRDAHAQDGIARRTNRVLIAGRDARAHHDGQAVGEDRIAHGARAGEAHGRAGVPAVAACSPCRCARERSRWPVSAPRLVRVTVTAAVPVLAVAAVAVAAPMLKKLPPSAPVRSMPSRCWAFTWFVTATRDAAELVARRIEHLAAPVEQSAERAAGDHARQMSTVPPPAVLQRQQRAFRVERIDLGGDLRRVDAEHQRLAIADEYVERRIAFGDHGNADLARQLVDERVALVEQIVRAADQSAAWRRRCRR